MEKYRVVPYISHKSPAGTIVKYEIKNYVGRRGVGRDGNWEVSDGIFDTREEADKVCEDKNKEYYANRRVYAPSTYEKRNEEKLSTEIVGTILAMAK